MQKTGRFLAIPSSIIQILSDIKFRINIILNEYYCLLGCDNVYSQVSDFLWVILLHYTPVLAKYRTHYL
jgi:hypothetical protein